MSKLIFELDEFRGDLQGGALSIGNFDGVHRGHARLVQRLTQLAERVGGPSVVFTFDPHPVRILRPTETPPPLTWIRRKHELLSELGVDVVVAFPTNRELLELSYQDFFQQIVVERIDAKAMVEGPNFFFGKNREGNINNLPELCSSRGIQFEVVEPSLKGSDMVSSSRIRQLIACGDVAQASQLLTQPYRIHGLVTHGAARGREIGFPTANLDAIDTLVPAHGVYAGRAYIQDNVKPAAIHIGPNPTFGENMSKVEIHILDFDAMVYGEVLEVDFLIKLRETQQFASGDALVAQLNRDVSDTRKFVRDYLH